MQNWIWRHRWPVGIVGSMVLTLIVIFGLLKLAGRSDYPTSAATPTITQSPARTAEEIAADEERADVQQWVSNKLPAYACQGRTEQAHFTKSAHLVFCPDYTAFITIKGSKASDVPVIVYSTDGIAVKAVHYREPVNNSDTGGKTIWVEGWRFTITYAPGIIPAGMNRKYNFVIGGINSSWTGPQFYEKRFGTETFAPETLIVEIYGASSDLSVVGQPIAAEKDPHHPR